jgi:hypothetical protein
MQAGSASQEPSRLGAKASTRFAATVAFGAAVGGLKAADFGASADPWPAMLLIGIGVKFGIAIGRWWAICLSLVVVVVAVVAPDHEIGIRGTVILVAAITVPIAAASLAVGVAIRRLDLASAARWSASRLVHRSVSLCRTPSERDRFIARLEETWQHAARWAGPSGDPAFAAALEAGMIKRDPAAQREQVRSWLTALLDSEGVAISMPEPEDWSRWNSDRRRWEP